MVLMEILFAPPVRVLITNCIVTGAEPGRSHSHFLVSLEGERTHHITSLFHSSPDSPLNDSHHQWDTGRAPTTAAVTPEG